MVCLGMSQDVRLVPKDEPRKEDELADEADSSSEDNSDCALENSRDEGSSDESEVDGAGRPLRARRVPRRLGHNIYET